MINVLLLLVPMACAQNIVLPVEDLEKDGAIQAIQQGFLDKFSIRGGTVTGDSNFSGSTIFNGGSTVSEGLVVDTLTVTGNAHVAGNATVGGTLDVTGESNLFVINASSGIFGEYIKLDAVAESPPKPNTLYEDNIIKAWGHFSADNGLSVDESFNLDPVTPITDSGVGSFTLNWDTPFENGSYYVMGACLVPMVQEGYFGFPADFETDEAKVICRRTDTNNAVDAEENWFIAIGIQ